MIKIDKSLETKLISLPESGMGFQIVNATFSDRIVRESIVLNANILEPINNRPINEVFNAMFSANVDQLEKSIIRSNTVIDVSLKSDKGNFQKGMMNFKMFSEAISNATGADKQTEAYTSENEKFVRFSHFENDNRIDHINMRCLPGTYATTLEDANYCLQNKIDPRVRYALPNSLEIKFAFHIHPFRLTPIKRGIVEPANNQPGGGKEVIFTKGTGNKTVVKIDKI
jgi:hypothetical protein